MKAKKQKDNNLSGVTKKNYFSLSQDEHTKLIESFYHVESTVRLVKETCFDRGAGSQDYMDISLCLGLAEEKLKSIENLISK
jgi:hypothetical protein